MAPDLKKCLLEYVQRELQEVKDIVSEEENEKSQLMVDQPSLSRNLSRDCQAKNSSEAFHCNDENCFNDSFEENEYFTPSDSEDNEEAEVGQLDENWTTDDEAQMCQVEDNWTTDDETEMRQVEENWAADNEGNL